MKERPILFNDEMVRALLRGDKTQTRRAINPQPLVYSSGRWAGHCRYGFPGDRLWVKEAHMTLENRDGGKIIRYRADGAEKVISQGNGDDDWRGESKWRSSIFMSRLISRIDLEIVDLRAQRIQEITRAEAEAEGCLEYYEYGLFDARVAFVKLWDSINAARGYGWEANPLVWVIEFRMIGHG
jgi:hypothetical protein